MIIVITGATGSGKSDLAIELAKRIDGEIINADAFQVYEELSIATAKPTEQMMKEVSHHLFSFVPLTKDYDVSQYQEDLRRTIKDVLSRGKTPIIAGGTGLYIRAGLYDYEFKPSVSVDMSKYELLTNEDLHKELEKLDPLEAKKIHMNNRIRVKRAIEICLANGKPKSELIDEQNHEPIFETRFYALSMERKPLYERVEARVDKMFEIGIENEVTTLVNKYGREPHAFRAIGVKEFFPYFDKEITLDEVKQTIKDATRHYIKRQETFFRHQFNAKNVSSIEEIMEDLNHE